MSGSVGMIPTGEHRTTGRETFLRATLSTACSTSAGLGSDPDLRGEKPATNPRPVDDNDDDDDDDTLRKEQMVWVFENGVLRRIFGPKRDELTGKWRSP
jgi:hypothetical protein